MIDVPILRAGRAYTSKELLELRDYATGQPVARVSMANPGLISRDLLADATHGGAWHALQDLKVADIMAMLVDAARHFMQSSLPVGSGTQSPQEFVDTQCSTTGLPKSLCRQNMAKIESAMLNMASILDGLTGGLDLGVLDVGYGLRDGHMVSYAPKARRFGAVLPANSPGVHALWLPAFALKMPLALKPGQREPWTPLRILESLRAAGYPQAAFGFYPSGHDGAGVILRKCGAAMMFGSGQSVRAWIGDSRIEIHGPGYSKVLLAPDKAEGWRDYLDLIVTSVSSNGGRSCINASSVRTVAHGRELAVALAERLAKIVPRSRDDANALLSAFADASAARAIDAAIERGLAAGGAEDVTAQFRGPNRLVEFEGGSYLLPTVIYCDDAQNPLANQEYMFPFVSVLNVPADNLIESLGPSLVVTALTDDPRLERDLMSRHTIGRLNLGPVPTSVLQWDQPHEGNIFDHLYQQRAFQREKHLELRA